MSAGAAFVVHPITLANAVEARRPIPRLGEIAVEASVLARFAEGARVDTLTVLRTLRKIALFSDGEKRCAARLARLTEEELDDLLAASIAGRDL